MTIMNSFQFFNSAYIQFTFLIPRRWNTASVTKPFGSEPFQSQQRERSLIAGIGLAIFILCYLIFALLFHRRAPTRSKSVSTDISVVSSRRQHIHRALSSFIVPTPLGRSRFPTSFLQPSGLDNAIHLNLPLFLAGIFSGKLELRQISSLDSLTSLIKGSLYVEGFRPIFKFDKRMWLDVACWVILGETTKAECPLRQNAVDLDYVSYRSLNGTLDAFLSALPSQGSRATIEFTTLAPHIKWLGTDFVLCAVPFMYSIRSDDTQIPKNPTSTPMRLSLNRVMEVLSLHRAVPPVNIVSCTNSSAEYSSTLYTLAHDKKFRGRADMKQKVLWKAALLKAGYIQRWTIIVVTN